MEYLFFIGALWLVTIVYHLIRLKTGKYRNFDHYMHKEIGETLIFFFSLTMAVICTVAGIAFIVLGGCVIRYLFM